MGDLTYGYNTAGQRITTGGSFAQTGVPQALSTATYDAANQQLTLGNKSATYDENGNLVTLADTSGTTTYTWNSRNQLTNISGPGLTASFQYDGFGRRKSKTVNGTTTIFLYDRVNVVQELNGATPVANLLTSLSIDETLLRTDSSGTRSFLADVLGSTLALTDPVGTVLSEYTYEPFGKTTATGVSSTNTFQYTGREGDGTELYYYRARYYSPNLQRFIAEDPLGFVGNDPNLYGYVHNDPLRLTDPLGLKADSGDCPRKPRDCNKDCREGEEFCRTIYQNCVDDCTRNFLDVTETLVCIELRCEGQRRACEDASSQKCLACRASNGNCDE